MRKEIYKFCFFIGLVISSGSAFTQNTNSPYSVYGIGDIDSKMYNRTSGMGSTGLALKSGVFLIDNNPASIAGLTRSYYLFNVQATGRAIQYSGTPVSADNNTAKDFWVKAASLSVKVNKFWAASVGFRQLSNINYTFNGSKQIEGSLSKYLVNYEGNGGLYDYYFTNAFSLGKHFMVGVKTSFIGGNINETQTLTDSTTFSTIQTSQQDYLYNFHFDYGALFYTPINKHWDFSIGGKFASQTKLPSNRTLSATDNGVVLVNADYIKPNRFALPMTSGVGIAVTHDKKSTVAVDYSFDKWQALDFRGPGWAIVNNNRISIGYDLSKMIKRFDRLYEKSALQFGAYYNSGYLAVNNVQISDYGITAGTTSNIGSQLLYNLSLAIGQRGSRKNDLIRENYVQLTLGLSFRDFLLSKGRKYD